MFSQKRLSVKFDIQYNNSSWYCEFEVHKICTGLRTANFEGQYLYNNTINTVKYPMRKFKIIPVTYFIHQCEWKVSKCTHLSRSYFLLTQAEQLVETESIFFPLIFHSLNDRKIKAENKHALQSCNIAAPPVIYLMARQAISHPQISVESI